MPQLLPSPWFGTLLFAWVVFLVFFPKKVTAHTFPHQLTPPNTLKQEKTPWNWPWA
uniref:ATP synthase complex subunit 8 n=1 Tax=Epinephelus corallicola TaxID=327779 RepID=A0A0U1ZBC1_9TELE|nr:ATP synthase F0 subunit 8 [Epinephelus corallicola]AJT48208.1 ATP synthase F0 subunit 8 [Epinephelus corallicola]